MLRIVITDDEDVIRAGLRTILTVPEEIEVVGEASTGSDALKAVAEQSPDVVVLDLAMPDGLEGAETARLLREAHPSLGILILTTIADEEQVARAWRAGADGYLLKTASGADMRKAVYSAAEHHAVLSPDVISTVMSRFSTHHHPAPTPEIMAQIRALSQGELRCVVALADGLGNREIADRLGLAEGTVKTHLSRALHKFGMDNRTQLALLANDQRELLTGLLH